MDKIYAFKQMGCQGSIEETFTATIMAIEDHFSSSLRLELSSHVHVLVEQEKYELNDRSTDDDSNKFKTGVAPSTASAGEEQIRLNIGHFTESANSLLSKCFHVDAEDAIVAVLTKSPECSIISEFERSGLECIGRGLVNCLGVGMWEEVDLSDPLLVESLVDHFCTVKVSGSWADPASFPEWPGFRKSPRNAKGVMGGDVDGRSAADGAAALGRPVCNVHKRAAHVRKRRCTAGQFGGGEGGGAGGEGVCMGGATVSATTGAQAAEAAPKQIRVSIRHFTGRRCAVALQRVLARLDSVPLFPTEHFVGIVHVVKFGVRNAAEAVAAGEEATTTTAMVITLQAEYVSPDHVRFTMKTLEPCEESGGSNSKLRDIVSPPKLQLRQVNQTKGLGVGLKDFGYGTATPGTFLVMQDVAVKESICLSSQSFVLIP
jgi:hypothetical protein